MVFPVKAPMDTERMEKIKTFILANTEKFAIRNGFMKSKNTVVEGRLQRIANRVRLMGGCMEEEFRLLVEDILEEKLPPPHIEVKTGELDFFKGSMIVLLDNPNSHNYPTSVPIFVNKVEASDLEKAHGIKPSGWEGNYLPAERFAVRPATESEIVAWISGATESTLLHYFSTL